MLSDKIASPSVRRAWIEMVYVLLSRCMNAVALREEGVDRNTASQSMVPCHRVALREEGVDRNLLSGYEVGWTTSRPP